MERRKALKEAFEMLYEQSSEHNLDETLMKYSFNKSKLEESKLKLSAARSKGENTDEDHCSSWKTKMYGRVKSSRTSRKHQRHDLRDVIDKLHLSNIVGRKTQFSTPRQLRSRLKRKKKSDVFLTRNIHKVRQFLEVSNAKESIRSKSTQRKTWPQFVHSEKKVNLIRSSNQTRGHARLDKTFDSGFYEFNDGSDSTDDDDINTLIPRKSADAKESTSQSSKPPATHLEKSSGITPCTESLSRESEFNLKTKRHSSHARKSDNTQPVLPVQKQTEGRSNVQSSKILFKPLFGNHCGNTWRQIVDEN